MYAKGPSQAGDAPVKAARAWILRSSRLRFGGSLSGIGCGFRGFGDRGLDFWLRSRV